MEHVWNKADFALYASMIMMLWDMAVKLLRRARRRQGGLSQSYGSSQVRVLGGLCQDPRPGGKEYGWAATSHFKRW